MHDLFVDGCLEQTAEAYFHGGRYKEAVGVLRRLLTLELRPSRRFRATDRLAMALQASGEDVRVTLAANEAKVALLREARAARTALYADEFGCLEWCGAAPTARALSETATTLSKLGRMDAANEVLREAMSTLTDETRDPRLAMPSAYVLIRHKQAAIALAQRRPEVAKDYLAELVAVDRLRNAVPAHVAASIAAKLQAADKALTVGIENRHDGPSTRVRAVEIISGSVQRVSDDPAVAALADTASTLTLQTSPHLTSVTTASTTAGTSTSPAATTSGCSPSRPCSSNVSPGRPPSTTTSAALKPTTPRQLSSSPLPAVPVATPSTSTTVSTKNGCAGDSSKCRPPRPQSPTSNNQPAAPSRVPPFSTDTSSLESRRLVMG